MPGRVVAERRKEDGMMRMAKDVRRLCVNVLFIGLLLVALDGCHQGPKQEAQTPGLAEDVAGTWFAYDGNVIKNMWTFRKDGTCTNDGWPGDGSESDAIPPYHLEGTYRVAADRIEAAFTVNGTRDTVVLQNPVISCNRLIYSTGEARIPIVFLRERVAVAEKAAAANTEVADDPDLPRKLIGSWVAFARGFPDNTWQFNEDGTFLNEGWAPLDPRLVLVKRTYQVRGRYAVSGSRIILTNERLLQFDPQTDKVSTEVPLSDTIVLYSVEVRDGRLVYTNEAGLPVVFRPGTVTPTNS